jgi:UDP-N-acetyl-D-glucosamine dehydrogenase
VDEIVKQLSEKIRARKAHVGIIGMGYVGLPLAVEFAKAGFMVTGLDLDAGRVQALSSGRSYIPDVPSSDLQNLLSNGRFGATTDAAVLKDQDAILICVPTPLNKIKAPDLSYVVASVEAVRGHLHSGQLVVLESTTYPGTTDEVVLPKLEETGLKVGRDFFLAFSPERVDPGNKQFNTRNTPKIVGGITPDCTRLAQAL